MFTMQLKIDLKDTALMNWIDLVRARNFQIIELVSVVIARYWYLSRNQGKF